VKETLPGQRTEMEAESLRFSLTSGKLSLMGIDGAIRQAETAIAFLL
jgi:hypothetical protein